MKLLKIPSARAPVNMTNFLLFWGNFTYPPPPSIYDCGYAAFVSPFTVWYKPEAVANSSYDEVNAAFYNYHTHNPFRRNLLRPAQTSNTTYDFLTSPSGRPGTHLGKVNFHVNGVWTTLTYLFHGDNVEEICRMVEPVGDDDTDQLRRGGGEKRECVTSEMVDGNGFCRRTEGGWELAERLEEEEDCTAAGCLRCCPKVF